MDLTTEDDMLYLDGSVGNLYYSTTNLNDSLTPERMIKIWRKFENKINLDKMVEFFHNGELNNRPMTWHIVLEMLYLLEECSSINGFDDRLRNRQELLQKINSIIKKMEKSSLDTQKQETKIRELYETARSLVSELRMVYILVKNNFDIKLIDGKNKRPDIEFIKNGLKADLKYSLPYNFSNLETNSCYTNENIKKDLLITARHYCREGDLKKADMIIINSSDLYFQNIFLGFTNVALPVKDAIERAFEIVNSGEKAIVQFRLPMPFSPREVEARKVFAFVMGESSIPFVKSSELRCNVQRLAAEYFRNRCFYRPFF